MPTYSFEHIESGDTMTTFCTWEEAQEVIKDGSYKMLVSAPAIVSGTGSASASKKIEQSTKKKKEEPLASPKVQQFYNTHCTNYILHVKQLFF